MHPIYPESARDVKRLYELVIHPGMDNFADGDDLVLLIGDIPSATERILAVAAEVGITFNGKAPESMEVLQAIFEGAGFIADGLGGWRHPRPNWKYALLGDLLVEEVSRSGKLGWSKNYIIIPKHADLRERLVQIASQFGVCDTLDEIVVCVNAAGFKKGFSGADGTTYSR